ncbi:Chemotaxis protein CheW [Methylobrevis pamukkalensis]|uniref:Chemotaxis protein CheW n=1 Tax=Methylobrevis pamukkalensis TaxID=1439726 RepID=A0A1E3GXR6_9HYPH|nr:Chemotaxis protein CheW [Methylobrevis pamukkalensis]
MTSITGDNNNDKGLASDSIQFVTVVIGGQLFGLPIHKVHDVFVPESMTRVPLAQPEIAGVLNLRGRIVTAINMRRRLGLPLREGAMASWRSASSSAPSPTA